MNKTRVNAIYQMGWKDIFYHLPKDVLANLNRALIIKSVKISKGALSNSNTLEGALCEEGTSKPLLYFSAS